MSPSLEEDEMIRVKPFLSVALAVAGVAAFSGAAHAQSPLSAWEVNIYLQDSERAAAAAALDQASRMPVGSQVVWNDTLTRAAGTFVPTGETRRADGSSCRTYDIVVNVPRRNQMVNRYAGVGGGQNRSVVYYDDPVQLSPAFSRRFSQQACRTASGALIPG
jgi:hypothetical protein